jgi:hypothetical protein
MRDNNFKLKCLEKDNEDLKERIKNLKVDYH